MRRHVPRSLASRTPRLVRRAPGRRPRPEVARTREEEGGAAAVGDAVVAADTEETTRVDKRTIDGPAAVDPTPFVPRAAVSSTTPATRPGGAASGCRSEGATPVRILAGQHRGTRTSPNRPCERHVDRMGVEEDSASPNEAPMRAELLISYRHESYQPPPILPASWTTRSVSLTLSLPTSLTTSRYVVSASLPRSMPVMSAQCARVFRI